MDYVDKIKKLKKELSITNSHLSGLTNIPVGTINKILSGETDNPSMQSMFLIAKALNCSLDYLLRDDKDDPAYGEQPSSEAASSGIFHLPKDDDSAFKQYPPEAEAEIKEFMRYIAFKYKLDDNSKE